MEQYLRRNRLSECLDDLGMLAVMYGAAILWFVWLWGVGIPALLAGAALGTLFALARSRLRQGRVERRETALRCRIGAELLMEELLLAEAREAHFRMAMLVAQKWPVIMQGLTDEGMLCRQGAERLLIICVRMSPEGALGIGDLAAAQRAVRKHGADRGILCAMGKTPPAILAKAEQTAVPLRIVRRETLMALASRLCPATDEQLIALGQRRRKPAKGGLLALVFRRDKGQRYFGYGLMMTLLYVATGVRFYAVPGVMCLVMAVLCRTGRTEDEPL